MGSDASAVSEAQLAYLLVRRPELYVLDVPVFIGHSVLVLQWVESCDHSCVERRIQRPPDLSTHQLLLHICVPCRQFSPQKCYMHGGWASDRIACSPTTSLQARQPCAAGALRTHVCQSAVPAGVYMKLAQQCTNKWPAAPSFPTPGCGHPRSPGPAQPAGRPASLQLLPLKPS